MDRAIILDLRRKLPHEQVERLRHAEPGLFHDLASMLCRFSSDNKEAVRRARPDLPPALHDRAQDNWEVLLAIADVAGGAWPELARKAALTISSGEDGAATIGAELLADIREVFETKRTVYIGTKELIEALCADDEKPWATYSRGKWITSRQLSKRLGDYNIKPKTIRVNAYETLKGYDKTQFLDAFSRYLPAPPLLSVTTSQSSNGKGNPVTDNPQCDGTKNQSATLKPAPILDCDGVTDTRGDSGGDEMIEEEI
jgi:putative DNA primase/helicase